jgi:hypothetical protein
MVNGKWRVRRSGGGGGGGGGGVANRKAGAWRAFFSSQEDSLGKCEEGLCVIFIKRRPVEVGQSGPV